MTSASRLLIALLVTSVVGAADAAEAPPPSIRLEVQATPDCTSQADLTARVSARLRGAHFDNNAATLEALARFTALPSGNIVGEVTLAKPGAKPALRRVVTQSCAQAADAVALIIAITVDPILAGDALAIGKDDPAKGEASVESSSENAPNSSVEAGSGARERSAPKAPPWKEPPQTPSLPLAETTAPRASAVGGSPRFGAGISGQMLGGVSPGVMLGVAAYAMAGFDRESLWSPAVMLGFTHGFDTTFPEPGGTANFWLDAASLDACALRLRFLAIETRACASALVGRLSATGTDTNNPSGLVRRPFAATGATGILTLRVDPLIELTARTAVELTLVRDSFEFSPLVFHTVPDLTFAASLGIGIRSR